MVKCLICNKRASFGSPNNKPIYCVQHKKDDMVDVVHRKCLHCYKRPSFGFSNSKPQYCCHHKKDDMVDLISLKCLNCHKCASFGFPGGKPQYCIQHKKDDMIDVKNTKRNTQSLYGISENKEKIKINKRKYPEDIISLSNKHIKL